MAKHISIKPSKSKKNKDHFLRYVGKDKGDSVNATAIVNQALAFVIDFSGMPKRLPLLQQIEHVQNLWPGPDEKPTPDFITEVSSLNMMLFNPKKWEAASLPMPPGRVEVEKLLCSLKHSKIVEDGQWTPAGVEPMLIEGALIERKEKKESTDDSAWVSASTLWPEKFDNYKAFKTFIDNHSEIRQQRPISKKSGKPLENRLEVHAGDWARYWKGQDEKQFNALDNGEHKPITPDPTDETVQRFLEIQAEKEAGK